MPLAAALTLASAQSQLHLTAALLALGVGVVIAGHITSTRWLIVIGIAIIAVMSALFSFVLRPGRGRGSPGAGGEKRPGKALRGQAVHFSAEQVLDQPERVLVSVARALAAADERQSR